MYEAATNAAPKNEELASLWFMALVKDMAFKEQQAAALKLNRQFKAAKYTTWAAAAARIQASEDPSNSNMMLALAERLAAKAWTDAVEPNLEGAWSGSELFSDCPSHENSNPVALFYLDLLLDQSKFNEALAFLDEEKTAKSFRVAAQRHKLRAELLVKLGRNREAKDQCLELLDKREDDWEAWMLLMEASTASTGESGWSVGELRKYLADRTAAAGEDGRRRRALLLVGLELIRREGLTMDLAKRLVDYVELHKSAYHLVGDVSRFLAALDEGGRAFLLRQIRSTLVEGEQKDIGAFANRIKLERLLGSHEGLTVHDAEELSGSLWATYLQTREQKGASNLQHAEDLALLASHLLLDISLKSGES